MILSKYFPVHGNDANGKYGNHWVVHNQKDLMWQFVDQHLGQFLKSEERSLFLSLCVACDNVELIISNMNGSNALNRLHELPNASSIHSYAPTLSSAAGHEHQHRLNKANWVPLCRLSIFYLAENINALLAKKKNIPGHPQTTSAQNTTALWLILAVAPAALIIVVFMAFNGMRLLQIDILMKSCWVARSLQHLVCSYREHIATAASICMVLMEYMRSLFY